VVDDIDTIHSNIQNNRLVGTLPATVFGALTNLENMCVSEALIAVG
jgi:hypothetical protein